MNTSPLTMMLKMLFKEEKLRSASIGTADRNDAEYISMDDL